MPKQEYTDKELVDMILQGGREQEKALYILQEQYINLHFIVVRRKYRIPDYDSMSVFNDALIALSDAISKKQYREGSLKSYFQTILKNKCLDYLRKRRRSTDEIKEDTSIIDEKPNPEEQLIWKEEQVGRSEEEEKKRQLLAEAMLKLSQKCRNILIDKYLHGLKPRQIAAKYEDIKNAATARSTLYECFKKLLKIIDDLMDSQAD
ncbi:MAG: sigma-70 family RNA polymerase sigma factor [Bacteroidota bacterium]